MRDPRVNPEPGDVVRNGPVTREVTIFRDRAQGTEGPVVRFVCTFTSSRMSRGKKLVHPMRQKLWTRLEKWRNWCRGAEVVSHPDSRDGELIPTGGA